MAGGVTRNPGRPRALYRLYDEAGALLYVGIALNPQARLRSHAKKFWWRQVVEVEVEWFGNCIDCEDAESVAIWQEHPVHNVADPIAWGCRPDPASARRGEIVSLADALADLSPRRDPKRRLSPPPPPHLVDAR